MNRRAFSKTLAATAALPSLLAQPAQQPPSSGSVPFGFSIMLWTILKDSPFPERLEKCVEAGYKNVELVGEYNKWSESEFQQNLAAAHRLGVSFDITAGLKHGICNPNDREAMLADIQHELPIMQRLNCPAVIVMSGNAVPGMPRDVQHDSCIEGLKRAASLVEGKEIAGQPVRVLLENIDQEENPRYYLQSVAEGFEIMKTVGHPQVQLLYDFFHEQIAEGNLIEKLEKNIQYTGLVHIADVPGRHEPGTGEINYDNIYRKLAQLNYNRIVAMEFHPLGDPVTELRRARERAIEVCSRA